MANEITRAFEVQFESVRPKWESMLPPHIPAERFKNTVLTAVTRDGRLLNADRQSLINACIIAARDNLLPDGAEGAITTFKSDGRTVAQWMPMVKGIIKRARELGDLTAINAYVVYEKDKFELALGDEPRIVHEPHISRDRGPIVAAYAIFRKGPEVVHREIMYIDEIENTRSVSRARNGGAWTKFYSEMCRKTVIRRGSKSVPMSDALTQIIQREDELVDFSLADKGKMIDVQDAVEVEPGEAASMESDEYRITVFDVLSAQLPKCETLEDIKLLLESLGPDLQALEDDQEIDKCKALVRQHRVRVAAASARTARMS